VSTIRNYNGKRDSGESWLKNRYVFIDLNNNGNFGWTTSRILSPTAGRGRSRLCGSQPGCIT
jgi:hypothetical protein